MSSFKCRLGAHDWREWRHDNGYVMSFAAYIRFCRRKGCRAREKWNPIGGPT